MEGGQGCELDRVGWEERLPRNSPLLLGQDLVGEQKAEGEVQHDLEQGLETGGPLEDLCLGKAVLHLPGKHWGQEEVEEKREQQELLGWVLQGQMVGRQQVC